MLKSKKKVVKKQKQKQKQRQTQNTKVIVNIGKTTKSKSRAPQKKAPEPVRPQIIPIYTPTYQSQPQQQYNNDDLRTLFRARTQANENPLKELTREIKLPLPNRPPIRLDEEKQGYTDPKLDYEVLLDYKDPPLDTRKPDRIMADAQFRAELNAEYQAFDEQFLKPVQTPTLAEAVEETTREELPTGGGGGGGGGGGAAEPEPDDDLNTLTISDLKQIIKGYTDNPINDPEIKKKLKPTTPKLIGEGNRPKNKDEIIADIRKYIRP